MTESLTPNQSLRLPPLCPPPSLKQSQFWSPYLDRRGVLSILRANLVTIFGRAGVLFPLRQAQIYYTSIHVYYKVIMESQGTGSSTYIRRFTLK